MSELTTNQSAVGDGDMADAPMYMRAPIVSREGAEMFIRALYADGLLFHFDDSPETIINVHSGAPIFTPTQCDLVRARVAEMFAVPGFDPFDLAVELI